MIANDRGKRLIPRWLKRVLLSPITWAALAPLMGLLIQGKLSQFGVLLVYAVYLGSTVWIVLLCFSSLTVANPIWAFFWLASVFPAIVYSSLPLSKAWRPINFFLTVCLPLKVWFVLEEPEDFPDHFLAAMAVFIVYSTGNIACGLQLIRDLRADPIQYSLRSLLGLMTFAAIALGIGLAMRWPWQSMLAAVAPPVFLVWGMRNALIYYSQKPICASLVFHLWRNFWRAFFLSLTHDNSKPWSAVLQKSMLWFDPPQALAQWWFLKKSSFTDSEDIFKANLTAAIIWLVAIYAIAKFVQIKRRRERSTVESRSTEVD